MRSYLPVFKFSIQTLTFSDKKLHLVEVVLCVKHEMITAPKIKVPMFFVPSVVPNVFICSEEIVIHPNAFEILGIDLDVSF